MATEFSFDVVSKVDLTEVKNAIDLAEREIENRFDFRGSKTSFTLEESTVKVLSDDEFRLNLALDVLRSRFAKRNISLKALEYGKIEPATGKSVRQVITLRQGIPTDDAKELVKKIKASGIKVQAQIQGEQLRITGKEKDALQAAQRLIKGLEDLPFDVEFTNYR
ncbi:MAG TPA: YajQ family cyclic di-GMP-binding protein [Chthonomonadaceae bacterium]|nr:YajQ family cyclic di-GMP-binding protein [Chthonomonadaceae bacterium]